MSFADELPLPLPVGIEIHRFVSRQAGTFGPALAVPLRSAAGISGVLLAVRDKGAAPFEPEQVPVLGSFADQAALALETARPSGPNSCWSCSPTATGSPGICTIT